MNKRALIYGLVYCFIVIVFKLIVLYGGFYFDRFWFNYSHILSVIFIIPFFIVTTKQVRDKERGGIIGGKEVIRICLTVMVVAMIVLSIYNIIEFSSAKFKDLAVTYYNSDEFLEILKQQQARHPKELKVEDFPKIINDYINGISAFKATTFRLVPLLFIGLSGAFIVAVFMKRSKA